MREESVAVVWFVVGFGSCSQVRATPKCPTPRSTRRCEMSPSRPDPVLHARAKSSALVCPSPSDRQVLCCCLFRRVAPHRTRNRASWCPGCRAARQPECRTGPSTAPRRRPDQQRAIPSARPHERRKREGIT